jgi:hypothetical protein
MQLPTVDSQLLVPRHMLEGVPVNPPVHSAQQVVPAVMLEQLMLQAPFSTGTEGPLEHTARNGAANSADTSEDFLIKHQGAVNRLICLLSRPPPGGHT